MNFRLNADDEVNFDVHSVPTFDAKKILKRVPLLDAGRTPPDTDDHGILLAAGCDARTTGFAASQVC
jgi:hypothetical protein